MRIFIKTLTYSIMHVTVATIVAYVLSGSLYVALSIGLIEPMVQTVFFFCHEHVWNKIPFLRS